MKNVYVRIIWRILNELLLLYGVFLCVRWLVLNLYHGNEVKVAAWVVILYVAVKAYIEIRRSLSAKSRPASPDPKQEPEE